MQNSYGTPYEFLKILKKHMVPPILFSKINMKKVVFLFQNIPKNSWNEFRYPPLKFEKIWFEGGYLDANGRINIGSWHAIYERGKPFILKKTCFDYVTFFHALSNFFTIQIFNNQRGKNYKEFQKLNHHLKIQVHLFIFSLR